ncbi:hypothetical protein L195_g054885, partial [Trifolium pratense]
VAKKLEKMAEIDIVPETEMEDKVKAILKLIKDGELDMDGTPEEILKREPLAELVKICEEKLAQKNWLKFAEFVKKLENEISQLAQKNLVQEEELGKLKKELTARTKKCSALQRKLNTAEKDASGDKAKVENLEKDLLSLKTTKEELELNCEKLGEERQKLIKEHAQTLKFFEDENNELASEIVDLQRTLKEQEDAHQKLNEEYKQVDS